MVPPSSSPSSFHTAEASVLLFPLFCVAKWEIKKCRLLIKTQVDVWANNEARLIVESRFCRQWLPTRIDFFETGIIINRHSHPCSLPTSCSLHIFPGTLSPQTVGQWNYRGITHRARDKYKQMKIETFLHIGTCGINLQVFILNICSKNLNLRAALFFFFCYFITSSH